MDRAEELMPLLSRTLACRLPRMDSYLAMDASVTPLPQSVVSDHLHFHPRLVGIRIVTIVRLTVTLHLHEASLLYASIPPLHLPAFN